MCQVTATFTAYTYHSLLRIGRRVYKIGRLDTDRKKFFDQLPALPRQQVDESTGKKIAASVSQPG